MRLQLSRFCSVATSAQFPTRYTRRLGVNDYYWAIRTSVFPLGISRTAAAVLQNPLFAEVAAGAVAGHRELLPNAPWPSSPPASSVGGHQRRAAQP